MPKSRKSFKYSRRKYYRRRYLRPTRSFTRKVKRVIYRASETKQGSNAYVNQNLNSTVNWYPFVPTIVQGAGDNQRIGNVIMSRTFSFKLDFDETQNEDDQIRVWVVWPRQLDSVSASQRINATNFPLDGLVDQDNFNIWFDRKFRIASPPTIGFPMYKRITFYKKFNCKMEYISAANNQPKKFPFIIVANTYVGQAKTRINGYTKMTYKDI